MIENSIIGEIHKDKNSDRNVNDVVRLYGCVDIDGKLHRVKTTVKRFKREGQQAYSYEVTEIEKLEGTSEADISQLPQTTNFSIDAAKLVNNFGSNEENGKIIQKIHKVLRMGGIAWPQNTIRTIRGIQ